MVIDDNGRGKPIPPSELKEWKDKQNKRKNLEIK